MTISADYADIIPFILRNGRIYPALVRFRLSQRA